MRSPMGSGFVRSGLLLGASWGVVEVGLHGIGGRAPLALAMIEILGSSLIGLGVAWLVGRSLRGESRNTRPSFLLIGWLFAAGMNLLIHPFLLSEVRLVSPVGIALAVLFAGVFVAAAGVAGRIAGPKAGPTPPLALVIAALLLGAAFLLGRTTLTRMPPGTTRIVLALLAGLAAEATALLVAARLRDSRATGLIPAALVLGAIVLGPALLARGPAEEDVAVSAPPAATPVVLISLDTTRPDHLSFFGYPGGTSPNLDRFLARSLVYPRASASSPWTLPSHASVFTGLPAAVHGAHHREAAGPGEGPRPLRSGLPTLAERFAGRGYRTAAVAANRLAVSRELGLHRGFQFLDARLRIGNWPIPLNLVRSIGRVVDVPIVHRMTAQHHHAATITARALAWMRRHGAEPFFLFVNYIDPHSPYAPPRFTSWKAGSPPASAGAPFRPLRNREDRVAAYDGEIAWMDRQLGVLFDGMGDLGVLDRAVVVVFSDHGEFLDENGQTGHGRNLDEPVLAALLAVRLPGGEAAGVDSSLVDLTDVAVLIEDALEGRPGRSVRERAAEGPRVVGEHYRTRHEMRRARWQGLEKLTAVRWENWKLVASADSAWLFDLASDPLEVVDLSRRRPDVRDSLFTVFRRWQDRHGSALPAEEAEDPAVLRELLRGLGYVQ